MAYEKTISLRVTPALADEVKRIAKRRGESAASVYRTLIERLPLGGLCEDGASLSKPSGGQRVVVPIFATADQYRRLRIAKAMSMATTAALFESIDIEALLNDGGVDHD